MPRNEAPYSQRDVAPSRSRGRDERWETLKRRIQLLARLGKPTLRLVEGLHIAPVSGVREVERLVKSLRATGELTRAELEATTTLKQPPLLVTRELLATAHRDLRAVSTQPALAMARDRRRTLTRYGDINEAWLTEKEKRIDALAALRTRTEMMADRRTPDDWFEAVLDLVAVLDGEESRDGLAKAARRLTALGAERRSRASARVDELLHAMRTGEPAADPDLAPLVTRLERAGELPGRARRSRVVDVLRKTIAWPEAPADAARDVAAPLERPFEDVVRDAARAMIQALPAANDREARDRALEALAIYGLVFRVGDDGIPLHSTADVDAALSKKSEALAFADVELTVAQALAVVALPVREWQRKRLATLVAGGLELDLAAQACRAGHGDELARSSSPRAARAFATWATRLVPHYAKFGIEIELSPELFTNLPKNEDVAMLAVCLMEESRAKAATSDAKKKDAAPVDPMIVLDATLGMFQRLPQKASGILARLRGTTEGAGRTAFPELAEWLGADAELDRFVHLARLAKVPVALTKALREDFDHTAKAERERAHLESLRSRSARQEARLQALGRRDHSLASSPRGRTRRRLAERIEQLLPIAYREELDDVFREILRDAWGIAVPHLTPAWRDAVRFWLVVDDNRELLGRLLREAAKTPGVDVKSAFPKNRAWVEKESRSLRLDRWTAPRSEELRSGTNRFTIALEEDPLEVLRMGIPFGTCLALDTGCNAASTVSNAVDVNKRVLYVRGKDGKIVARKLLAITKQRKLVGYNLYLSIRGGDERAIRTAVNRMCRTIADEVGLPLARAGVPENLHEAFWYDDGTVNWEEDVDVASYCHALEVKTPDQPFGSLMTEARASAAMLGDDIDTAISLYSYWEGGAWCLPLGEWIVKRLGVRETLRRSAEKDELQHALVRSLGLSGEDGVLEAMAVATRCNETMAARPLMPLLDSLPRSARVAKALAELAVRSMRVTKHVYDSGLAHLTFHKLPPHLEGLAASFDALDMVEPAWAALCVAIPGCDPCRRDAWMRSILAVRASYERYAEAEEATLCLMSRHRGELAQRAAVGIAAKHVLPNGARALGRLATLRPDVASSPFMLAAVLRQEGIGEITDAVAKRLPKPSRPPFEALGELLFEVKGIERTFGELPKIDVQKWAPGPWELAWYRRRGSPLLNDELERVARKRTRVTHELEQLALLGDVAAVDRVDALPAKRRNDDRPPQPTDAKLFTRANVRIPTIARAIRAQVDAADRGRLPPADARKDVVDRRLREVAMRILADGPRSQEERLAAVDVFANVLDTAMRWDDVLVLLAEQGDAPSVKRILTERVALTGRRLAPETTVAMWKLESIRPEIAESLVRKLWSEWSSLVTACERTAERTGSDVSGLFEEVALGLVERGSFHTARQTETLDQLRTVCRVAATRATPARAAGFYEEIDEALTASFFLRAMRRLPLDRAAAIREAATKLRFASSGGAVRREWLVATRPPEKSQGLKKRGRSSIERG